MATSSPDLPDVEQLVEQLRERVEARRLQGRYPEGLEASLDGHFHRIAAHRVPPYEFESLRERVSAVHGAAQFEATTIALDSRVPGGPAFHGLVAKIVNRQTVGILEQVSRFGDAVREALQEVMVVLEHPNAHGHPELLGQIDAVLERLAEYERTPVEAPVAVAELTRRLERLEADAAKRRFRPWFSNERFEEAFRGSGAELRERYASLADEFAGVGAVVDLGCGRGEFLQLLEQRGISARGVEIDHDLVENCLRQKLTVELGDAVAWLRSVDDASLGGISLLQVIEHLTAQEAVEVVALAAEKLRPGGKIIVETVNPQSLYVFAHAFYADPTHDNPVHPAYLTFLFREAGFEEIRIEWRSPPPEDERLVSVDDAGANRNVERLNQLLFAPQDYALIATR